MAHVQQDNPQERLIACRAAVDAARATGTPRQLCLALIDLGGALFHTRDFQQGVAALDESEHLAATLADPAFMAHCLGLQAAAYEDIGRFHNAFEVIGRVVMLAEAEHDQGMKCDAFVTQAQILANSGEPVIALEKLKEARTLASQLDDKHHLMKTLGALGNINTTLAALEDAQTFFEIAAAWADRLGEQRAECGYLLNLGTVLVWQKVYPHAQQVFERARTLAQALEDRAAELAALRYLTENLHMLEQPEAVPPLARHAITLAQDAASPDITFSFFKTLILAFYRTDRPDDALDVIQEAVAHAQAINAPDHEVNMLLQLGESCMALGRYDRARQAYQQALDRIQPLDRAADAAHIVGRMGVVLAELGQVQEAVTYHQRAIDLAREQAIPALEGEQLTMLALAYADQQELDRAHTCCQDAIAVFSGAGFDAEADKARLLLSQLS